MHATNVGRVRKEEIVTALKKTVRKDALLMAADIPAGGVCLLK
jgi:hypothetical protein